MIRKECLVLEQKPFNFIPQVEVSGCYCEFDDTFLLLKRHPNRPQGNSWGLPAGKKETGETPLECIVREVAEETGMHPDPLIFQSLGKLFVQHPELDFIFHLFYIHFDEKPEIAVGLEEHLEARWVTLDEACKLSLIGGGHEVLQYAIKKIARI